MLKREIAFWQEIMPVAFWQEIMPVVWTAKYKTGVATIKLLNAIKVLVSVGRRDSGLSNEV